MRCHLAVACCLAFVLQIGFAVTAADAEVSTLPCDAFAKNADGSWTVLTTTYVEGPNVKLRKDAVFPPGFVILGYDIAALLAKACPNAQPAQPAETQAQQPQKQSPSVFSTYADANGNYDVSQLTCGHLDLASPDEAQLFLAWYSGWYNGLAKGHGINLARVKYNIQSVIDYCKVNRDKKLTDVMRLMLK